MHYQNIATHDHTLTLSTQSMFRCSGIVVIHTPFVDRKNIPFSAANHMLYSLKFCKSTNFTWGNVATVEGIEILLVVRQYII